MPGESIDAVREVFEQWELYEAIIRHDYMRHRSLRASIANMLSDRSVTGPVLDLGCGDGWLAERVIASGPSDYLGVDLSESALQRAAERLSEWPQVEWICGDLQEVLPALPTGGFDLVLASYSLHHFANAAKRDLVQQISRVLQVGGRFLWADIIRREQTSRADYLTELERHVRGDWSKLNLAQQERVVEHVRASDFPETVEEMRDIATKAGFEFEQDLFRDEWFTALPFVKSE